MNWKHETTHTKRRPCYQIPYHQPKPPVLSKPKNGNLPQIGIKIKSVQNHRPEALVLSRCTTAHDCKKTIESLARQPGDSNWLDVEQLSATRWHTATQAKFTSTKTYVKYKSLALLDTSLVWVINQKLHQHYWMISVKQTSAMIITIDSTYKRWDQFHQMICESQHQQSQNQLPSATPRKLNIAKIGILKRKVVFQPSFFRGELLRLTFFLRWIWGAPPNVRVIIVADWPQEPSQCGTDHSFQAQKSLGGKHGELTKVSCDDWCVNMF